MPAIAHDQGFMKATEEHKLGKLELNQVRDLNENIGRACCLTPIDRQKDDVFGELVGIFYSGKEIYFVVDDQLVPRSEVKEIDLDKKGRYRPEHGYQPSRIIEATRDPNGEYSIAGIIQSVQETFAEARLIPLTIGEFYKHNFQEISREISLMLKGSMSSVFIEIDGMGEVLTSKVEPNQRDKSFQITPFSGGEPLTIPVTKVVGYRQASVDPSLRDFNEIRELYDQDLARKPSSWQVCLKQGDPEIQASHVEFFPEKLQIKVYPLDGSEPQSMHISRVSDIFPITK